MSSLKRAAWVTAALVGVSFAAPAHAQMNFEGLDLGGKKKKKDEKKKDEKKKDDKKDEKKDGSPALPEGGVDLTKPVDDKGTAKKDDKKGGTAPGMSFDAVDVSGKTADRQRLDAALNQFKDEKYEESALSAYELMNDPKMAGLGLESQYLLAKALYRMGLYHSALGEFSKVLSKGPNTKFFKSSLEWLFFIGRKTVNEQVVLDEIVKYSNYDFPDRFRNEFRYLLARYHLVRGQRLDEADQKGEADKSFEEVKRLALMIPKGDPFYPRAKYLEGVAYYRGGKPETALESLKEVVRTTKQPPGPITQETKLMQSLRELAFMQLARIHYEAKQNRIAAAYYGKVERGNVQWLEALFESSWANYRVGQYEQALGNMITLGSPFFRDEYFPETLILKAVIYFENCRYRETLIILEDFERIYGPVQNQLEEILAKKMEAAEYYKLLADIQTKNKGAVEKNKTDEILERVLNLALTDKDLKKTTDSITELEGEIDGLGNRGDNFKFSALTKALIEGLKAQREALIGKAGVMSKGKLEFENSFLKTLRANGLRIRFETTDKEKQYLELQLTNEAQKELIKKIPYSVAVPDDYLYWPFVAEYWRDELGTYQYTLTKGCIDPESGTKQTTKESGGQ
jgi:tetratricopeptide (TPR) repeat protein